jgi:formyltetrahydrofolate synthetase
MENGAMRNFESLRLAEKQAETEAKAKKDEEENNPMKILENRTRDSRREMAVLETLEDLRELNTANANVDTDILLNTEEVMKKQVEDQEREEDEEEIRRIFGTKRAIPSSIEEIVGEVLDAKTLKQKYAEEEEVSHYFKKPNKNK